MSQRSERITIKRITEYEHEHANALAPCGRPVFHLAPPVGWMNDPNGFSYCDGRYHLFYQYYPFDTKWGPVSWGHAVSSDLLHWEQLPPALVPDQSYDSGGCFSGTAVTESRAGRKQMIMYTGYVPVPGDPQHRGTQTQCIAFGDGLTYEKYEGNPVITSRDLPEGADPYEFRDPKLFRTEDGYRAILANRNHLHGAQLLQYRSADGLAWEFERVLAENREGDMDRFGWMWECPDLFPMGERQILLISAMDVKAEDAGSRGISAYHNGKTNLCMIGEMAEDGSFRQVAHHPMDQGLDFYAGQTMQAPDGRRILIGWMQDPDTAEHRSIELPINGQMSLPRELTLRGEHICQRPIRELEHLREDPVIYRDLQLSVNAGREHEADGDCRGGSTECKAKRKIERNHDSAREHGGEIRLDGIRGRVIDMELSIRPCEEGACRRFGIRFAGKGNGLYTELTYLPQSSQLTLDRSHSGPGRTSRQSRQITVRERGGRLELRLVLDRLSAEVFINDGEQVMSAVIYTDRTAEDISFFIDGVAMVDIAMYRIKEK